MFIIINCLFKFLAQCRDWLALFPHDRPLGVGMVFYKYFLYTHDILYIHIKYIYNIIHLYNYI